MSALDDLAEHLGLDPQALERFGVSEAPSGAWIAYRDKTGAETNRRRLRGRNGAKGAWSGWAWSEGDDPLIPYGLDRPIPFDGKVLVICEGESDAWACWSTEIAALGIPGATNAGCLRLEHVAGAKAIAVIQEPDDAGGRFPHRVAQKLYDQGFDGEIAAVSLAPHKDARAAYCACGDLKAVLVEAWGKRTPIERPQRIATVAGTTSQSLAEMFEQPEVPVDWLVDGLLTRGGIMLLSAKPKVGKTVLARSLAWSIATGKPFLGRDVTQGTVLWVALEERKEDVLAEFRRMGLGSDSDRVRLHAAKAPDDVYSWLEREIDAYSPIAIFIDTWYQLTNIDSMNDYAQVGSANRRLLPLSRSKGVAQVWIHHDNKGIARDGSQILGSQGLFATADLLFAMRRSDEGLRSAWTIQRTGEDMDEVVVSMDAETHLVTSPGTKYEHEINRAKEAIVALLGEAAGMSRNEIIAAVDQRSHIVGLALTAMTRSGAVVGDKDGRTTKWRLLDDRAPLFDEIGSTGVSEHPAKSLGSILEHPGASGVPGASGAVGSNGSIQPEGEVVDFLAYAKEKGL